MNIVNMVIDALKSFVVKTTDEETGQETVFLRLTEREAESVSEFLNGQHTKDTFGRFKVVKTRK